MWAIISTAIGVYVGGLAVIGTMVGIEEVVTRYRERKREKEWKVAP